MGYLCIWNKQSPVWLFSCTVLYFGLLFGCSEQEDAFNFLTAEIDTQHVSERNFLSPYSEQLFEFNELLFPVLIEATENGIFVLDVADDSKVSRFNWNFDLETKIGRGTGEGPGEIGGVNDIHVEGDTLYFTDAENALIHLYTIDNEFVRSISIDNEIASQVTVLDELLVVRTGSDERPLFIDKNGIPSRKTDPVSSDEIRYRFVLESRLFSDNEYLYRMPSYFGLLIKYDRQGSISAVRELIDATESLFQDETTNTEEQPPLVQRDNALNVTVSAGFDQDKLCLLRFYRNADERFIDCYRKTDLEYLFSFIPPENTMDFKIHKKFFTAIHDSSLTVWEWNLPESL